MAWCTLFGGGTLLVTRLSLATVVEVHGDGMAPTLVDGDHVLLIRQGFATRRGDVVVYDPSAALGNAGPEGARPDNAPPGRADDASPFPDARRRPHRDLRNTAVIDPEELADNWEQVKARSDGPARGGPLRLGRVLARPGDRVTFHQSEGALGLAVEGNAIGHKEADTLRISLSESNDGVAQLRALAYETTQERRYPVLVRASTEPVSWSGIGLPPHDHGPVELEAPGFLVVADNRDGGECCDSRALGWIPAAAIRAKVSLRLPGDPKATPDLDPSARGLLWDP